MSTLRSLLRRKPVDAAVADCEDMGGPRLRRVLGPSHLVLLGVGAVIGAGIFATVGTAAVGDASRPGAGPALILSFVLTAIACGLAALCYAEFASMVPVSGSAYTYAYTTMGELVAWIIGWDLIIEYAVGNVAVAISWSGYFTQLLEGIGIHLPDWATVDFRTALQGEAKWRAAEALGGLDVSAVQAGFAHAHAAVSTAPSWLGVPLIFNFPAMFIVLAITAVLVVGIRESVNFNAFMVVVKLLVLGLFIVVGARYIDTANYHPFAPNGWEGIRAGAAIVFFAYIGFDAVSTVAEETRNPGRDLPIGIIGSLIVSTLVYIVVAAVLTGMLPLTVFTQENKAEPLVVALQYHHLAWVTGIVALGSVVAHTCVLLVFQLGQPRIFFSMSRDGLLPPVFARIHPRFRTPHITTIVTGLLVALCAGLTNIDEVVDLTNIGTLFAFALVCIGVIVLRHLEPERRRPFKVPWSPVLPLLGAASCVYLATGLPTVTWIRFGVWLVVGLILYFGYGYWKSRLKG